MTLCEHVSRLRLKYFLLGVFKINFYRIRSIHRHLRFFVIIISVTPHIIISTLSVLDIDRRIVLLKWHFNIFVHHEVEMNHHLWRPVVKRHFRLL